MDVMLSAKILLLSMVVLTVLFYVFVWIDDYIPNRHVKIYGTRYYKIVFTYTDFDKFGPKYDKQLEDMKFYLDKVVSHITINEMWEHYKSRKLVQSWVDEYYTRMWCLYKMYKSFKKGRIDQEDYNGHLDFCEGKNAKMIENLRRFNMALVKELNQRQEIIDQLKQSDEYDEELLNFCTVDELKDYLEKEQEHE